MTESANTPSPENSTPAHSPANASVGATLTPDVLPSAEKSKRRKPKAFRLEFSQKDAETWRRELLGTPLGAKWGPDLNHVLKNFVATEFSKYIKSTFSA